MRRRRWAAAPVFNATAPTDDERGSEIKGDVYRTFRFRRVGSLDRAEREGKRWREPRRERASASETVAADGKDDVRRPV